MRLTTCDLFVTLIGTGIASNRGRSDGLREHLPSVASRLGLLLRCPLCHGLQIRGQAVIDAATVVKIFTVLMGCWALGFGMGKSVAWVRAIRDVA